MLGLWATSGFSCSSNNPVQICLGSDIGVLNVAYSYVAYLMYSKMAFLGSLHARAKPYSRSLGVDRAGDSRGCFDLDKAA